MPIKNLWRYSCIQPNPNHLWSYLLCRKEWAIDVLLWYRNLLPSFLLFVLRSAEHPKLLKLLLQRLASVVCVINLKAILAVMSAILVVVKIRPENNLSPYGIWTHDLCVTVERCVGIAVVMGWNPVRAWIFFRSYFHYYFVTV